MNLKFIDNNLIYYNYFFKYEGEFLNGFKSGYGVLKTANGDKYNSFITKLFSFLKLIKMILIKVMRATFWTIKCMAKEHTFMAMVRYFF